MKHEHRISFIQRKRRAELVRHYLITNSAHTPKPEKMFEKLLRDGVAYVQRRHGMQPIIVFVKDV